MMWLRFWIPIKSLSARDITYNTEEEVLRFTQSLKTLRRRMGYGE